MGLEVEDRSHRVSQSSPLGGHLPLLKEAKSKSVPCPFPVTLPTTIHKLLNFKFMTFFHSDLCPSSLAQSPDL